MMIMKSNGRLMPAGGGNPLNGKKLWLEERLYTQVSLLDLLTSFTAAAVANEKVKEMPPGN